MKLRTIAIALALALALPIPLAQAAQPVDYTPDFTDENYHEYLLYDMDQTQLDVIIMPPVSPFPTQGIEVLEESVDMWIDGINALAPAWLRDGLNIDHYTFGVDPIPSAALSDPEVVIISSEMVPFAYAGIGLEPMGFFGPYACHNQQFPLGATSWEDLTKSPDFHQHPGSEWGSIQLRNECSNGGSTCFVINGGSLAGNTPGARRTHFDLNSHEFGHCIGIGHVGDADDFKSLRYPRDDIMSYENDGWEAGRALCVSTLNIVALEATYGFLLGRPGANPSPSGGYVWQDPGDWDYHRCSEPDAEMLDMDPVNNADPLGLADPDDDNDGVPDTEDVCNGSDDNIDSDGDGTPDGCDSDRDGDGTPNANDAFPDDPTETTDSDGDGVGDNTDACPGHSDFIDSDGDGIPDGCDDDGGNAVVFWLVGDGSATTATPADGSLASNFAMDRSGHGAMQTTYDTAGSWNMDADENFAVPTFITASPVTITDDTAVTLETYVDWTPAADFCTLAAQLFDGAGNVIGDGPTATPAAGAALGLGGYQLLAFNFQATAGSYTGLKVQFGTSGVDCGNTPATWSWGDDAVPARLMLAGATSQPDSDGDGVPDTLDVCHGFDDNIDQDGDTTPDGCDDDRDGDGVDNGLDAFPDDDSEWTDSDGDGHGDNGDVFPNDATEWADSDSDGVGDNSDVCPGHDDNVDLNGNGTPDGCDNGTGGPSLSLYMRSPEGGVYISNVDQATGGAQPLSEETPPDLGYSFGVDNSVLVGTTSPNTLAELVWQTSTSYSLNAQEVTLTVFAESTANPFHALDCGGLDAKLWVNDGAWTQINADPIELDFPAAAMPGDQFELTGTFGDVTADGILALAINGNSSDCGAAISVLFDDIDYASRLEIASGGVGPVDTDGDGYTDDVDAFPNDPTEWADSDLDGVGDNSDACPGHDDNIDDNGNGTPDGCDVTTSYHLTVDSASGTSPLTIGGTYGTGSSGGSGSSAKAGVDLPDSYVPAVLDVPLDSIVYREGPPLPDSATGIGPGSHILIRGASASGGLSACTANFVYEDVVTGKYYLGAAGHCFLPAIADVPNARASHGTEPYPVDHVTVDVCVEGCDFGGQLGFIITGDLERLGKVVYARQDADAGTLQSDFGLVEIPAHLHDQVRTHMFNWEGPVGGHTTNSLGDVLVLHGYAAGFGETFLTGSRAGVSTLVMDDLWCSALPSFQGDSGSAVNIGVPTGDDRVMVGGQALGILTHLSALGVCGTTVDRALDMAMEAGLNLRMMNQGETLDGGTGGNEAVEFRYGTGGSFGSWSAASIGGGTWSADVTDAAGDYDVEARYTVNGVEVATATGAFTIQPDVYTGCTLQTGVTTTVTLNEGDTQTCRIDVPAGRSVLDVVMAGPECDVEGVFCSEQDFDLYVKAGSAPTTSSYDCRPYLTSNNEACNIADPAAGFWYAMVDGYQGTGSVNLTATYNLVDSDGDGVDDEDDVCPGFDDNEDVDQDGIADGCDPLIDSDRDGVADADDQCPGHDDHADVDGDGTADGCDDDNNDGPLGDLDGDGVNNENDAFPNDSTEWSDADGDGYGDNSDLFPEDSTEWADRDSDGVGDNSDAFPDDATEWSDADSDGVGDNSDACAGHDDNVDSDGDGLADGCDGDNTDGPLGDSDGDGVANQDDAFPNDSTEWNDADSDGVGDNSDAFPQDGTEWADSDSDGVGDNSDVCDGHDDGADLDGDGFPDGCDGDRDGDGFTNEEELASGTNPDDANSYPVGPPQDPNGGNMGNGNGNGPDCSKFEGKKNKPAMCRD